MAGEVHAVDSIVAFFPANRDFSGPADVIGHALVVVRRDMWVIKTELRNVRYGQVGEPGLVVEGRQD